MKTNAMMMAALLSATEFATMGLAHDTDGEDVVVCAGNNINPDVFDQAQAEASRIFRHIGVRLNWHPTNSVFCLESSSPLIQVTYSLKTAAQVAPRAFARAMPYEGVHIEVFYDRVPGKSEISRSHVLAHILAHEISHILKGTDHHSDSGIMKARWVEADYKQMEAGILAFNNEDVLWIHKGIQLWANRSRPATFVALAKP